MKTPTGHAITVIVNDKIFEYTPLVNDIARVNIKPNDYFADRSAYFRIAVLISLAFGLAGIIYKTFIVSSGPQDLEVYYYSARRAMRGEPFIGAAAGAEMPYDAPYGYLPVSIFFFYPFALLSLMTSHILLVLINIVVTGATVAILVNLINMRGYSVSSVDKLLISGLLLISIVSFANLHIGQINHLLLFFIMMGYYLIVTDRPEILAGVMFAVPALVKIWPAVLGLWLLKQRAYRAAVTSLVVGVGGLLSTIFIFGINSTVKYFLWLLTIRSRTTEYAGGIDPNRELISVRRMISVFFPTLDTSIMTLIGIGLVGIPVAYVLTSNHTDPLDSFTACLIGFLLVFPSISHYMLYPLPLLVLYAYSRDVGDYEVWLSANVILIPMVILPRNVMAVVQLFKVPTLSRLVKPVVTSLFTVFHPPTVGLSIFLITVAHRSHRTVHT